MKKYIKKRITDLKENMELSKLDRKYVNGQIHEIRELIEQYSSDEDAIHFSQKINEVEEKQELVEKATQKNNFEPIFLFSRYKIKNNELRLSILKNQAQDYNEIIHSGMKSSEVKLNPDFLKDQEHMKEELVTKTNEDKPIFISKRIDNLKEISSNIKDKVTDFQNNKFSKENLFKDLEKQIAEFEAMIELLKAENQSLKKELELLIEQQQKSTQKNNLEKENSSLKEKIEAFKNKDKTPFDEDLKAKKPLKANKITYNSHEQER